MTRASLVVGAAVLLSACGAEMAPYGGDQELALAKATLATDVSAVTRLLGSGADPGKMVRVNGSLQSPWFLVLHELRPGRPEMVAIVKAMLQAGASPNTAWGTDTSITRPPESVLHRFFHSARTAGSGTVMPLELAMRSPAPEVVRAIVSARGFDPGTGESALVEAVEAGETEIVHLLVEAGVDVNCHRVSTPLVASIETRNVALMTYLEDHGAREKP